MKRNKYVLRRKGNRRQNKITFGEMVIRGCLILALAGPPYLTFGPRS